MGVQRTIWATASSADPLDRYIDVNAFVWRIIVSEYTICGTDSPGKLEARLYRFTTDSCSSGNMSRTNLGVASGIAAVGTGVDGFEPFGEVPLESSRAG